MASKANFVIEQGSDLEIGITIADDSGIDVSGYTCRSQMRKHALSANGVDITCSITGVATLSLTMTNEESSNVEPGRWMYDVELVAPSGLVTRVVEGLITVTPEITK